jgi:integrase
MSSVALVQDRALATVGGGTGRHADEADYLAYLWRHVGHGHCRGASAPSLNPIKQRRRFVRLYPDLDAWFGAPLPERVGSRARRASDAFAVAQARPYLYFLACSGRASLDWPWIFAVNYHVLTDDLLPAGADAYLAGLVEDACALGYGGDATTGHSGGAVPSRLRRIVKLFCLNRAERVLSADNAALGEDDMAAFEEGLAAFGRHADLRAFYPSQDAWRQAARGHLATLFTLRTLLYHRGAITTLPTRTSPGRRSNWRPPPRMAALADRYRVARLAQGARPATATRIRATIVHFADWLGVHHPECASFADVRRDHVLTYAAGIGTAADPSRGGVASSSDKISRMSALSVFFQNVTAWGWEDAPARPLLSAKDLPKRPARIPRYIPADQLACLMAEVEKLSCPYQRGALVVARWSGARRSEVRNLELDCLDAYPDGTPRLRIPVGKTNAERLVPVHPDAGAAIRLLQSLAPAKARGFADRPGEPEVRRLFVRCGRRLTTDYLFAASLGQVCTAAGHLGPDGRPTITAHRFRHTLGTQLAEGGARLHTIMKMLGHTSTEMTLVYAHLSEAATREDYQRVLGPGAAIAGPLAEQIRSGAMPQASLDWLRANFFRTELELGHCLRLPEEGPCECDLYLTCAKFVTTPAYAPRLRERRSRELELIDEAATRGWTREVERHRCVVAHINQLLTQLGEVIEPPNVIV